MTDSQTRIVELRYTDPLELIWMRAAASMGIEVQRDPEVFAAWDGNGILRIGTPETLDADDSLAQMILHEVCHALVEGPDSLSLPDWGLNMLRREDRVHEHACLRLQAALTKEYGLRSMLAPTTDFRVYYDALPDDPLTDEHPDSAIEMALEGFERAKNGDWSAAIDEALRLTSQLATIICKIASENSIWLRFEHRIAKN